MSNEENFDLSKIEPGVEDFVKRRINHIPFAKVIYWLCYQSKKNDFVYITELAKFMKLTRNRAYDILNDLAGVMLLEKRYKGSMIEYWFVKNDGHLLIEKYLENSKRVLGLI